MNFITKGTSRTFSAARLGDLSFLAHAAQPKRKIDGDDEPRDELAHNVYETPMCFVYTKDGVIPNITWELSDHLQDDDLPIMITLADALEMESQLREAKTTLASFCRVNKNRPTFLSVYNPLKAIKPGRNDSRGVAVYSHGGKSIVNAARFVEFLKSVKVDGFQCLADSDTPQDSSKKRLQNSIAFTQNSAAKFLEVRSENFSSVMFATVEGGFDMMSRTKSAQLSSKTMSSAYVIDGFHAYGQTSHSMHIDKVGPLITETLAHLPDDKPRAMFGQFLPEVIAHLVSLGVDIFDTSYASYLASQGEALLIDYNRGPFEPVTSTLNLLDEKHKSDHTVLDATCQCYTCKSGHTKVYINHLLITKEMLASVLLSFHNLHVFIDFFKKLRMSIKSSTECKNGLAA
ncbi:Queuine tRNA-ribosyltransferase [Halotydeus destructor]|nr:Queuine tRNA-ribosyltransferase [Halotydeus destructor]